MERSDVNKILRHKECDGLTVNVRTDSCYVSVKATIIISQSTDLATFPVDVNSRALPSESRSRT
jgi:hypothetical protein